MVFIIYYSFWLFQGVVDLVLQPLHKLVLSWLVGMVGLVLMCGITGGFALHIFLRKHLSARAQVDHLHSGP